MVCRRALIEKQLAWNVDQAADLASEIRHLRREMEDELIVSVANFEQVVRLVNGSLHYPELQPITLRIRRQVGKLGTFLEPGHYEENLKVLQKLSRLHRELSQRILRYDGIPVDGSLMSALSQGMELSLGAETDSDYFILIDSALNRLYLRNEHEVVLEAVCSTGSGYHLVRGSQEWVFQTPRGEFSVERKIEKPIWRKPDWAFIEAGQPVPSRERERLEADALGEYAFDLGDGYFIHGTLYTRLLGEPVTHGCIRLASGDLMQLAAFVEVGTKVFIF
jgi:L,D-transpeptidase YbiS